MATLILVRHGRTTANADGVLAGRTAGVHLDDVGREQAERTAERLAVVPLIEVVSSPLERCRETAQILLDRQERAPVSRADQARQAIDGSRPEVLCLTPPALIESTQSLEAGPDGSRGARHAGPNPPQEGPQG